ncbi:MAG: SMI1/KNR4 family protein [Spirochaetia bacterium]
MIKVKNVIKLYINRIITQLNELNRPVVGLLNEPISKNSIESYLCKLPIILPGEVVSLFLTINGTKRKRGQILDDIQFFPGFYLLSIGEAVEIYTSISSDPRWSNSWFPIFANGGGDFYCAVCDNINKKNAPILGYILGEEEQIVEYLNLDAMLKTIAECFELRAYYVDEQGFLEINDDLEKEIAKKNNPGIDRWQF